MPASTTKGRQADAVVQFSVFTPNRLGRLHELVGLFCSHNVHVLAITVLDTTESAIIRMVLDDPDKGRELLHQHGFPFTESRLVVVELTSPDELNRLVAALLSAELNINYLYSFIPHPHGKSILGLNMEDNEMAEQVLKHNQFPVLKQSDLSR
ncbi:MAG: acetolactate synthase [Verrucomicrobiota bacterium]